MVDQTDELGVAGVPAGEVGEVAAAGIRVDMRVIDFEHHIRSWYDVGDRLANGIV